MTICPEVLLHFNNFSGLKLNSINHLYTFPEEKCIIEKQYELGSNHATSPHPQTGACCGSVSWVTGHPAGHVASPTRAVQSRVCLSTSAISSFFRLAFHLALWAVFRIITNFVLCCFFKKMRSFEMYTQNAGECSQTPMSS